MTDTTNYLFNRPTVGGSEDTWGASLNENWAKLDALLYGASYTDGDANTVERIQPDLVAGSWAIAGTAVTATAAELNILDGVTATTAELNTLDGITATVTELNYTDGVTSNIQTQLDAKQGLDATLTALAGLATGANKVPYSTGTDTFGQLDFVDEDDMASDSATAVPSQQSVKAYVDAQDVGVGVGQTWQDVSGSRAINTSYQNTTGKPIVASIKGANGNLQVSTDNSTWITVKTLTPSGVTAFFVSAIVPDDNYYRVQSGTFSEWVELR